jgi:hypothetical protein
MATRARPAAALFAAFMVVAPLFAHATRAPTGERPAPSSTSWVRLAPWKSLPRRWRATETLTLLPRYEGERERGVRYLGWLGRQRYRLTVRNGLLYDRSGKLFDTRDANAPSRSSQPRAIFVVGPKGEFYAAKDHKPGLLHHSSFLAGKQVAAAGDFEVIDGVLTSVSNHTGHYGMPDRFFPQLMSFFSSRGIHTAGVRQVHWSPDSDAAPKPAPEVTPEFLRAIEDGLSAAIHRSEQQANAH